MHQFYIKEGHILLGKGTAYWRILKALFKKGKLNAIGISKATGLDYSYCHKRIQILKDLGFLMIKDHMKGSKGRLLKYYGLTDEGSFLVLALFKLLDKEVKSK